jgi:hypothetical protein
MASNAFRFQAVSVLPTFYANCLTNEKSIKADDYYYKYEEQEFTCIAVDLIRQTADDQTLLTNTQLQGYTRVMNRKNALFNVISVTNEETFMDLLCTMVQTKKLLLDQAEFISNHYFGLEVSTKGYGYKPGDTSEYLQDPDLSFTSLPCFETVCLVSQYFFM